MLNPIAVQKAKNAPKASYVWIKNAALQDLERAVFSLDPKPEFETDPWPHQLACFYIGVCVPTFAFFLDMRLGKSKIMLDIHRYRARLQADRYRTLVLVPQLLHFQSWEDNVAVHAPDLRVTTLEDTSARWEALSDPTDDVYVINYQGLALLLSDKREVKEDVTKFKLDRKKARRLAESFDQVVFDESTAIKNHQSLWYATAKAISSVIPYRYCLTGTPFGKDPEDLWPQFYVLDQGATLCPTLGLFREIFYKKPTRRYHDQPFWQLKPTFDRKHTELLGRWMENRSIAYKASECFETLPELVPVPVRIPWDMEAGAVYAQTLDRYREHVDDRMERENNFIKLRQITAGFIRHTDPETGEQQDVIFGRNPKVDALLELIQRMPRDAKMVIFHFFVPAGEIMSNALTREGITHVRVWGGAENARELLRTFQQTDKAQVLVINEAIGSMALDLQMAGYIVFYDIPVCPIVRAQAEKRCFGPKRKAPVFMHDLLMVPSVDLRIQAAVKDGRNLREEVVHGGAEL